MDTKTMNHTFQELLCLAASGVGHKAVIEFGKKQPHEGFDESEDQSMCAFYYPDGVIMVVPWCRILKFYVRKRLHPPFTLTGILSNKDPKE